MFNAGDYVKCISAICGKFVQKGNIYKVVACADGLVTLNGLEEDAYSQRCFIKVIVIEE